MPLSGHVLACTILITWLCADTILCLQATITSAAAVEKVLKAQKGEPATIVGLQGAKCIYAPLVETVIEVCG